MSNEDSQNDLLGNVERMSLGLTADGPWLKAPALPPATSNISTEGQLQQAVGTLTNGDTLVLAPGTYHLTSMLAIRASNRHHSWRNERSR